MRSIRLQRSLIREKVTSHGPDLHVVVRDRLTAGGSFTEGSITPIFLYQGMLVKQHLALAWKGMEHHRTVRIYFDPNRKSLKYCTPDGHDIPGAEVPWAHLVRYKQPVLQLAYADGLIDAVPRECGGRFFENIITPPLSAPHVTTLDFELAMKSAPVVGAQHNWDRYASKALRRYTALHFIDGTKEKIRYRLVNDQLAPRLMVPYIDKEHNFRLWDIENKRDLVFVGRPPHRHYRSAIEVRKMYQNLFKFAQSLGYWKDIPPLPSVGEKSTQN